MGFVVLFALCSKCLFQSNNAGKEARVFLSYLQFCVVCSESILVLSLRLLLSLFLKG